MHWITSTFMVLLCTFFKADSLLFHGQTNATSVSSGHSDPDVYKQLLHLEKVLDSILMDQKQQALQIQKSEQRQKLLEEKIQTLKQLNQTVLNSILMDQNQQAQRFEQHQKLLEGEIQTAQMKISFLESENKILKERLDNLNSSTTSSQQEACLDEKLNNLNSTSTFLLQENIILKDQLQILNSTSMLIQQNLTTSEDIRRLENILTFEIEQTIRDSEQKMMKNMSVTITDLELRDRYLSLSLLDVHNHTAALSSSLSNLESRQNQMNSEIQMLTNSQQNDITKLNNTIINLKNRVQFNVAFTAAAKTGHTYASGDTVIFPTVIYQVGGGYNPTTGVFTVPKAGLYLIFCTNVADHYKSFWTQIIINGSPKVGVMAYLDGSVTVYQSASNLVVHQLQMGDRVWTKLYHGSSPYSNLKDTTFSVIMINGSD